METAKMSGIVKEANTDRSQEAAMLVEFTSKQNKKLGMDLEERGIVIHYAIGQDRKKKVLRLGQSWASVHALLAKIYTCQTYSAWDRSLSVWMQNEELCLRFHARDLKLEEECKFSQDETLKIMDFLGKAPNLN